MKIVIRGRLPGLNEIIHAAKKRWRSGGGDSYVELKRIHTEAVKVECLAQCKGVKLKPGASFIFEWYEKDKRRDKDNIAAGGRKLIFDGMEAAGLLKNDGWGEIGGWTDLFFVDKKRPRIVVTVQEERDEDE